MRRRGLLDLDSRKGKAPGGYQSTLDEVRLPFIFMNAAGTNRDVFTLLHEGGHAFHAFASRNEPLLAYRGAPMEFSEVASMSMELFGLKHLDVFYPDAAEFRRARRRHFEDIVQIFPWIATIDAFQHWIYLNPEHGAAQREEKWLELEERFSPGLDWTGLEEEHRAIWQRQLHLFEVPFYYIEYGIAQMGALQLWRQFRDRPRETLENYRQGLRLGGSRPLPKLFEGAGINFDFSAQTLKPIMAAVAEVLNEGEE
jgi:oligoendopeptidase F